MKTTPCAVIIVTYKSAAVISKCLQALREQTQPPAQIIVVDSGSPCTDYLTNEARIELILSKDNIGFCIGNNIGVSRADPALPYILFLNPDAFLPPTFLEEALAYMEAPSEKDTGVISGLLLGYNMGNDAPSGMVDSAGIFRTWYGRWYDRSQGEAYSPERYRDEEESPALCGALLFCRKKALESVLLGPHHVLDASFYMYKEDIDLSLRLREKGWKVKFVPKLHAYHCRGWQRDRQKVPKQLRLLSARNEMRLFARRRSPCILYSTLKYLAVKLFNV